MSRELQLLPAESGTVANPVHAVAPDFHPLRADRATHLQRTVAETSRILETSFFRGREAFQALRATVLPALIAKRTAERTLRIWSAACSTGQEVYSIAMLLVEDFPQLADWDVQILGSDISQEAIDYARRGRYCRAEVNHGLPIRSLVRNFHHDGDAWEVSPHLRRLCEFRCFDVQTPSMEGVFDLILFRNALLQIPQRNLGPLFAMLHGRLAEDGVLLLGESEQAEDWSDLFFARLCGQCWHYTPRSAS